MGQFTMAGPTSDNNNIPAPPPPPPPGPGLKIAKVIPTVAPTSPEGSGVPQNPNSAAPAKPKVKSANTANQVPVSADVMQDNPLFQKMQKQVEQAEKENQNNTTPPNNSNESKPVPASKPPAKPLPAAPAQRKTAGKPSSAGPNVMDELAAAVQKRRSKAEGGQGTVVSDSAEKKTVEKAQPTKPSDTPVPVSVNPGKGESQAPISAPIQPENAAPSLPKPAEQPVIDHAAPETAEATHDESQPLLASKDTQKPVGKQDNQGFWASLFSAISRFFVWVYEKVASLFSKKSEDAPKSEPTIPAQPTDKSAPLPADVGPKTTPVTVALGQQGALEAGQGPSAEAVVARAKSNRV